VRWFPLLVAAIVFILLTTWASGRRLVRARLHEGAMPIQIFIQSAGHSVQRVPGTAVFLASTDDIPPALLHNLKHNKVLHDRVVILTVAIEQVPHVAPAARAEVKPLGEGFYRIVLHYGFMDEIDIPAALHALGEAVGDKFKAMETSYFLARQTLIASSRPGMAIWREKLFALMVRNAESAMEFFKLPTNRVVELGSQVEI